MANTTSETVILGGNGKTGRRIATRLQAMGRPVRLASRSTPVSFDWHAEETWEPALAGAKALYVSYHPDLAVPGAAQHVEGVSQLAARLGIERVVLLAGRGEPQVHPAEDAVRNSGVDFTILECAFFCQNFTEGVLAPHDDRIVFAAGDVREPFVDCNDIADVAVAALTGRGHSGKTYELTGPEAVTFADAARILGAVSGRPITYQQVSFEQYGQLLQEHMPAPYVEFFVGLFRDLLDGHNTHTTTDVERVLQRPATSFEQFATAALAERAA